MCHFAPRGTGRTRLQTALLQALPSPPCISSTGQNRGTQLAWVMWAAELAWSDCGSPGTGKQTTSSCEGFLWHSNAASSCWEVSSVVFLNVYKRFFFSLMRKYFTSRAVNNSPMFISAVWKRYACLVQIFWIPWSNKVLRRVYEWRRYLWLWTTCFMWTSLMLSKEGTIGRLMWLSCLLGLSFS